ncbi:MAG TPA: hypothetical protein VHH73_03185, partial [Verrucomicrobiae bacterium]|nr:hypothetical protein [Verrucomicrobiae bacterium]
MSLLRLSFGLLFAGISIALHAAVPQGAAAALTGYWSGAISLGPNEMRMLIQITKAADGTLSGVLKNPDMANRTMPVNAILFNAPEVRLEVDSMGSVFTGQLSNDGTELSGSWRFGFKPVPVKFTHSTQPPADPSTQELSYEAVPGTKDIHGYWSGALEVPGQKLNFNVKIGKTKTGEYFGELDVVDQGARGIRTSSIAREGADVKIAWGALGAQFKANLNDDGSVMDGTWTQGNHDFPLKLTRSKAPRNYDVLADKELSFSPPKGKADVNGFWSGTLRLPDAGLRLGIKIGRKADGSYRATLDSLDQGANDIPVGSVIFTNAQLRLELPALHCVYTAMLTNNNQTLVGTWDQGGHKLNLDFKRTDQPAGTTDAS